jgi:hypothetical protein
VSGETLSTLLLAIVIGVPVIIVVLLVAWPNPLRSQEKRRRREWEQAVREHRRKYGEDPPDKGEHEEASGGRLLIGGIGEGSHPHSPECVERLCEKSSCAGQPPHHEANHGSIYQRFAART